MRITYITAGAGEMYCGSCIRDNALAAELMASGHDVELLPMYVPTLTDEENVSNNRVFYGGISVYLEQHLSVFRHTPWLLDRLWESPWLLRTVAGRSVQTRPERLGNLTVSVLEGHHGNQAKEIEKLLHWLKHQPKTDVVDISNSMLIALAKPLKETLQVPVCCTLQGEDIFLGNLQEPYRERALNLIEKSVPYVDRFLAVSKYCAEHMSQFLNIPREKIEVVPLGININGYTRRPYGKTDRFTLGYFGRVAPEKGVHILCEIYKKLRSTGKITSGALKIGGYLAHEHETYLSSILEQVRQWGLDSEVTYEGKLDRVKKIEFFNKVDVLAVPALYDAPKGLALLEAMACGVPIVVSRRGTYTELIEQTGGGLLIPPDNSEAFMEAIGQLVSDPIRREELSANGIAGVNSYYTTATMASRALAVYSDLVARASNSTLSVS